MPRSTYTISQNSLFTIADNATTTQTLSIPTFGIWARVVDVRVTLGGLSHAFPDDLDFLFAGPDGTNLAFWSDVGGGVAISSRNYTIAGDGAAALPDSGGVATGTYRPADYDLSEFSNNWTGLSPSLIINHPGPAGAATFASAFGGKWMTGTTWSLHVRDDESPDAGSFTDWGFVITYDIITKPHDFSGLGSGVYTSDILWQNSDGTPAIWLMVGFTGTAAGSGPNPGTTWHVKGDADFDFNGKSDILWQNDDGTPGIWLMDGLTALTASPVGINPGPAWQIKGTGDFNFDGKADILWQNADGTPGIWLMNGLTVLTAAPVGINPGPAWQVKGSGDFNNDGKADILWQSSDGTAGIWLMDGMTVLSASAVGVNPGPAWQIKGSGDFNNDGKADILWQATDGTAGIWLMDGLNVLVAAPVGTNPGTTWHIKGSGDYDGDGKSDILWQQDGGQAGLWTMDGLSVIAAGPTGSSPGADWHIIG